jgi:hypothetical protein
VNFYIQDPTIPYSYSLHEALLQGCSGAQRGGGAYAFVSQDGVKLLLEDDVFKSFVDNGIFRLVVGIDEITNENALKKLSLLRDEFDLHWLRGEARNYLSRKKNESEEDYEGRLRSFQSWLVGDWDKQHIAIEEWAIKEFRKHRKRIKEILKYD